MCSRWLSSSSHGREVDGEGQKVKEREIYGGGEERERREGRYEG